ncbi:YadA family autotransporter adhesin [Pseudomonas guariconensis]|uniref:YadA family autotransporter adhesin n=1 Tax=Pseudomonas guariconensis TaxID=1288410 RepID=UPI001E3A83AC|nr:hypothetical protein [Pseudomonas guariconensis]
MQAWVVVDVHAATHDKPSRDRWAASLHRVMVIGLVSLSVSALPSMVFATTYGPSSCSSPANGVGPDNVGHPVGTTPTDGSGIWSNIVGCSASGNNYLGVQVMGALATTNGDGATAVGFAANAGIRSAALGMQANASGINATALGPWAQATQAGSVAIGGSNTSNTAASGAQSTGANALAIIGGSSAAGDESIAVGARASAAHNGDIAIGPDSVADGTANNLSAVAIGRSASASAIGEDATAYGNNAKASANYAAAIGNYASASGTNALAIGNSANASANFSTALGNFASASNTNALALGNSVSASGASASAVGNFSRAEGSNSIAMGTGGSFGSYVGARATAEGGIAIGGNTAVSGIALGRGAVVSTGASYAIAQGDGASAQAERSVALGAGATAANADDIALGAGSRSTATVATTGATIDGTQYSFAGTTPGSTLSIGDAGRERTLTNVAAGRISATSTDAINGSQLAATHQALEGLSDSAVKYDMDTNGAPDYSHITLNPGGTATTISNVAEGELSATSTEAVNGSQLHATNQRVDALDNRVDGIVNGGAGIKYVHVNGGHAASLPDSQANGLGSTAIGPGAVSDGENAVSLGNGATAKQAGDVALGAGSVADRGAESYTGDCSGAQNNTAGTVSVGAPGAERTVSNVADGRLDTDAVNKRQLDGAVKDAKDYTDQRVKDINGSIVEVGEDLEKLDERVTQNEGDVQDIKKGAGGMFQTHQGDKPNTAPKATGRNSVAGGSAAVASGENATALGNDTKASGKNATAIGNGRSASGSNSVALGQGSQATRDNSVAVGAEGAERQITHVAAGTAGTDAVNVNQLREMEMT